MINSESRQTVYRIALPKKANLTQKRIFEKNLAAFNLPTSDWVVHHDWPRLEEQSAYLLVPKSDQQTTTHTAYKISRALGTALVGSYQ